MFRIALFALFIFGVSLLFPKKTFSQGTELTPQETEWIKSRKTLKVANELDWPPFDFVKEGKPAGYSIDLIKLIAQKTGLQIDFVNGYSWAELVEQFRAEKIDILPAVYKDDERGQYMAFTSSYFSQPTVLITNSNNSIQSIEDLNNKKVAVIEGFSITKEIENQYPEIIRIPVNGVLDGLKKVSAGEVDAFIESIGVVSYYLENDYLPNIKIISDANLKKMELPPLYIGVQKDDILLKSILQKGLDDVSPEEMRNIRRCWITIDVKQFAEKDSNFSLIWQAVLVILIVFIILYFVFRWFFKRSIKEETALQFGSRKFRFKSLVTLGILVFVIAGLGWLSVVYIETKFSENIKLQLENDLNSARGRIDFWLRQKKEHLKSLGHDEELVSLSGQLLDISSNFRQSRYDVVHKKLAGFFDEHNYKGSFIIDRNLVNIGAEDTEFVGKPNTIANYTSELFKAVFKGEVVFIPPILSDSITQLMPENSKASMMYFAIPIADTTHYVFAALIQEIDPAHGFSDILRLSHVGETGESYVFNRNGRMLSRSRFEEELMALDIFREDQYGNLSIEIRDPGGNLTTGFKPRLSRQLQPLTLMAASATSGERGVNVKGYRDYRGVDVMGAWQWIDEMELGLATEIDVEEAMTLFYFIRLSAIFVLGITLIFIIASILFTLTLGEKANYALIKAKEELEDRVVARTQELNKANEQVKSIIENASDAIISIDAKKNIVFFNPAAERIFGYSTGEIAGKSLGVLVPEVAGQVEKGKRSNEPLDDSCILFNKREIEAVKRDGTILFMENSVSTMEQDGKTFHTVFLRDITERKKAEKRLKSQSAALKSAANGIVITNTKGEIEWVNPAFTKLTGYSWKEVIGKTPGGLNSGKHGKAFFENMWRTILKGEVWHDEVINKKKNGELFHEEMTITPILNDKLEIVQFVAIKQDISERKRLEEIVIKAKERMEGELNVAKDIQMSMLPLIFPAFPQRKEIDLYAALIPAREVGGDFYDFYFLDDNNICFLVGDVSGKGVPAALMMAVTKTLLKSRAGNDNSTASILTHVNNEIAKDNTNYMFITVFIAILNTNTGEMVYSNAGHNPSFIISHESHATTKLSDLHGPVVGAMEEMTYTETRLNINKDDIILAYTDGVTEAQNKNEELYSDARFENLLQTGNYDSPETLTKLIIDSVHKFEEGAEQFDDITVLAVQYNEDPYTTDTHRIAVEIKNKLTEITSVIDQFEAFGMENKIPMLVIQKFNIAFDELLNNIISYGYDDEDEHTIDIEVELKGERMIITLTDDGIPFNPFQKDPPDTMLSVDERNLGGLGIHIVKNLVDEYEYKRNIDKNIITLVKFNINT